MAPPATSRRLAVLEAIQTALRGIDGNPTYHHKVKSTSVVLDPAVNILTVPASESPYFIIEPTPEGSKQHMPAGRVAHWFQVTISARGECEGGSRPNRKTEASEKLLADIEVAIAADITLGGLVVHAILDVEPTIWYDLNPTATSVVVVQPLRCKIIRTNGEPEGDA